MMKKLMVVVCALVLTVGVARGQDDRNIIRLIASPDCAPLTDWSSRCTSLRICGPNTIWCIVANPWNESLDRPIATVGGFEFKLLLPENVPLIEATVPSGVLCLRTPPTFYCAGGIPVVDGAAVLAEITFDLPLDWDRLGYIFIAPVDENPSIPGSIAITDADDYSLSEAFVAGGLSAGQFILGDPHGPVGCIVNDDRPTWSAVKALYR